MRKKILTLATALLLSVGSLAAYAVTCSTTITKSDGTTIQVEVEGSACTLDLNSGVCRCI